MSSLAIKVSSEKALDLHLACKSRHKMTFFKFESFACTFQGTMFDILLNSSKVSLHHDPLFCWKVVR